MTTFQLVASRHKGGTFTFSCDSASETLDRVHQLREDGCDVVMIYRDGDAMEEMALVAAAAEERKR